MRLWSGQGADHRQRPTQQTRPHRIRCRSHPAGKTRLFRSQYLHPIPLRVLCRYDQKYPWNSSKKLWWKRKGLPQSAKKRSVLRQSETMNLTLHFHHRRPIEVLSRLFSNVFNSLIGFVEILQHRCWKKKSGD